MRDFVKYKSTNYILAKIDDINNYFIVSLRDFVKYKSTNYILAKIDDINNYFIVSPKGSP